MSDMDSHLEAAYEEKWEIDADQFDIGYFDMEEGLDDEEYYED